IAAFDHTADGVNVTFHNGERRGFDLVIGDDGLHSNVRRLVFGEEAQFLRDLGMYLCVYSVPNYLQLNRMEVQFSELRRIAASGRCRTSSPPISSSESNRQAS